MKKYLIITSGVTPHTISAKDQSAAISKTKKKFNRTETQAVEFEENGHTVESLIKLLQSFNPKRKVVFPSAGGTSLSGHGLLTIKAARETEITRLWLEKPKTARVICLEGSVKSLTAS